MHYFVVLCAEISFIYCVIISMFFGLPINLPSISTLPNYNFKDVILPSLPLYPISFQVDFRVSSGVTSKMFLWLFSRGIYRVVVINQDFSSKVTFVIFSHWCIPSRPHFSCQQSCTSFRPFSFSAFWAIFVKLYISFIGILSY